MRSDTLNDGFCSTINYDYNNFLGNHMNQHEHEQLDHEHSKNSSFIDDRIHATNNE